MKKWIVVTLAICIAQWTIAQTDTPAYKRFPTLPPIQLLLTDSTTLTKGQLKKQPTIIMFFSPTCDHCQHQMDDMLSRSKELDHVQFVLATFQPFEEMVEFYNNYKLDKHPNIKVGRDIKYTLPPFYNIRNLPYLALYNKKGELITTFEGNVKVEKLLKALD